MLSEYPFQLIIKNIHSGGKKESLLCNALLRSIPGRRKVMDAIWNGKSVVVKIFSDKFRSKRHLKREWKGLINLKNRKLNVPEPLFCGRTENYDWAIVTEKISGSLTAMEALEKLEKPDENNLAGKQGYPTVFFIRYPG